MFYVCVPLTPFNTEYGSFCLFSYATRHWLSRSCCSFLLLLLFLREREFVLERKFWKVSIIFVCLRLSWKLFFVNSRRQPLNGYYLGALLFNNLKELNCIGGAVLSFVETFSWFLKSNWSSDFGHAETRSGEKKRVVLRREMSSLYF